MVARRHIPRDRGAVSEARTREGNRNEAPRHRQRHPRHSDLVVSMDRSRPPPRSEAGTHSSRRRADMTVVVLQPGYLPWLGFFDQMRRADVFVYYDDVQYDTHGWRNRNRIKTQHGPLWLTVPVRHSGLSKPRILDVAIDSRTNWAKKHVASIRQAYAAAVFVKPYVAALEEVLMQPWERLVDL